jgi:biotin-dependent carboxylase-like uncharacterized protein
LVVVRPGALTLVEDAGRPGHAHLAVPRSGALDRTALAEANRLVGNEPGRPGLEATLTGVALRATAPAVVAVTGALAAVTVDGRPVPLAEAVPVPAGAVLDVGTARSGLRSYVAVAGGIALEPVLGSCSTDVLSGLGPLPLRAGDVLPVGGVLGAPAAPAASASPAQVEGGPHLARDRSAEPLVLTVVPGPRDDWFTAAALATLVDGTYRVSKDSNRIALRLDGPALERAVTDELPSEGLVLGAVQVPADGQPLVFLADHPTTGGYPVIAVVEDRDVDACAQVRPGDEVRFRWSTSSRPPPSGGDPGRYGAGA